MKTLTVDRREDEQMSGQWEWLADADEETKRAVDDLVRRAYNVQVMPQKTDEGAPGWAIIFAVADPPMALDTRTVDNTDSVGRIETSPPLELPSQGNNSSSPKGEEERRTTTSSSSSTEPQKNAHAHLDEIPAPIRRQLGSLGVTSEEAPNWLAAWQVARLSLTPKEAIDNLSSYLASCAERRDDRRKPTASRWQTWWTTNEERKRRELESGQRAEQERFTLPPDRGDLDAYADQAVGPVRRS
jgi:hypothetical protein